MFLFTPQQQFSLKAKKKNDWDNISGSTRLGKTAMGGKLERRTEAEISRAKEHKIV